MTPDIQALIEKLDRFGDLEDLDRAYLLTDISKALREAADALEQFQWRDGEPPKPWRDEWFIAMTIHGDRVVLKALPDEYTYDYTTADETYIKATNIKKWMQFPDSQFLPPPPKREG